LLKRADGRALGRADGVAGGPNKTIAYRLNITESTVKVHVKGVGLPGIASPVTGWWHPQTRWRRSDPRRWRGNGCFRTRRASL